MIVTKRIKRISLAAAGLLAASSLLAYAAGMFPNFPIVGGASYCGGFATGTSGQVCTTTVPAGPTIITGNELIPADTNLSQGRQPQTVLLKMAGLGIGPYEYNAPLTGASITPAVTSRRLMLEPAGTIATLTVVLPAATALVDNQMFGICTTQIVTALTITPGTGTTVSNTVTALLVPVATGAASCVDWIYRQANTNWYRVQ